jgi:hypothetical protein
MVLRSCCNGFTGSAQGMHEVFQSSTQSTHDTHTRKTKRPTDSPLVVVAQQTWQSGEPRWQLVDTRRVARAHSR